MSIDPAQTPEPEPKSFLGRLFHFFDSTRVGMALLGFLLTGILGAGASALLSEAQRWQEDQAAAAKERSAELQSIQTGIANAILQRETSANLLLVAFRAGASEADIDQLWDAYIQAYRTEVPVVLEGHLAIQGHDEDDIVSDSSAALNDFWYYLDGVLQARFESMHDCLLQAHYAFKADSNPLADKFQQARNVLDGCVIDARWDGKGYSDPVTKQKVSVADWDDFRVCVEDYTYLLGMSARLQNRAWSASAHYRDYVSHLIGLEGPNDCAASDALCLQQRFLASLHGKLQSSCGNIQVSYE